MDINEAHKKLGHIGEAILCKMMAYYNVKLARALKACDGCMHAKAKAKNLKKVTEVMPPNQGNDCTWMLPDCSKQPSISNSKFDAELADHYSHKAWTVHIKSKTQIVNLVKQHLDALKGQGRHIKYL